MNLKINEIRTDRVLANTSITLSDYVINPYRGCQFGCDYCYTKNNKNLLDRTNDWGNFIDVKINSLDILKKELEQLKNKKIKILLGSTTEPFQPIEQQYKLTRAIIELLKQYNIPVIILTKSPLIIDDLELLTYSTENIIYFTYNSPEVKTLFEKETPSNQARLAVIQKILQNNIKLTVYISPYFPYISEYQQIMDDIGQIKDNKLRLNFEGYNLKMGHWLEIKAKLSKEYLDKYYQIYNNLDSYQIYWDNLKEQIMNYNAKYHFKIDFLIYPYNDYYRNEFN